MGALLRLLEGSPRSGRRVQLFKQFIFQVIHRGLRGLLSVAEVRMLGFVEHDDQVNVMNRTDLSAAGQATRWYNLNYVREPL